MSGHTPGPWRFAADDYNDHGGDDKAGSILGDGWYVAEVCGDVDGWQENAGLITAAPDLLAACAQTIEEYGGQHAPGCQELPPGYDESRCCFIAAARAAIAKAEGK